MSHLVQSLECMVGAGVKGIMGFAEGYLGPGSSDGGKAQEDASSKDDKSDGPSNGVSTAHANAQPLAIPTNGLNSTSSPASPPANAPAQPSKLTLPKQEQLLQVVDVPSGWIHLQSTYLDGDVGQKKVRSFNLKNLVDTEVEIEVESDLGGQLVFWLVEDDKNISSSASSTSSLSTNAGTSTLHTTLSPQSTSTISFAFQPTHSVPPTPAQPTSPFEDPGFTPRVKPVLARTQSSELSPIASASSASDGRSDHDSLSGASSQSVLTSSSVRANSSITSQNPSSRRSDPVNRAFSIHGSIIIRAVSAGTAPVIVEQPAAPAPATMSHQIINLPFFATVCRSRFTAAPIDPAQGLVTGSQVSSGELLIDFGGDSVVGNRYHRDILLVNRSEIELIWKTTVVSSPFKDSVWFELRDLDSENVFGVDHSSQPVPLPALSSRHLRLELRAKAPVQDFDFTFLISNANQSGNVVTCRAVGSALAGAADESLILLSGNNVDFGKILDGVWARQMITCKNNGDKPIDVKFTATKGYDVVFRLAGVAGEDMDEDIPLDRARQKQRHVSGGLTSESTPASAAGGRKGEYRGSELSLSRTSTRETRGRSETQSQPPLRNPRAESPVSAGPATTASKSRPSSIYSSDMSQAVQSVPGEYARAWQANNQATGNGDPDGPAFSDHTSSNGHERDVSQPPSRALSRISSRTSGHLLHAGEGTESESEDNEPPFFSGGDASVTTQTRPILTPGLSGLEGNPLKMGGVPGLPTQGEQIIPDQIEEVTMRPGTEYRVFVLYRGEVDMVSPPEIAGALRKSAFKVYLEWVPSRSRSATLQPTRKSINCVVESCTSLIRLPASRTLDFGEVTVGASRTLPIQIENLSALSAKVEIAAISKVITANRNVIVIPPFETVEERLEFFPRRINEKYEKQMFVRNLLNRKDDQLVNIKSRNVDVYNLTLHSHLYRILTPSGSNFLDFGSVVINAPSIRTMHIENLSASRLVLELSASQTEDIELYVKAEDEPLARKLAQGKYPDADAGLERVTSPPNGNGELKERFMETLQELSDKSAAGAGGVKKTKNREKSASKAKKEEHEPNAKSVGQQVAVALKKGGRGRPVQLYGNAVVFKDRTLLEPHEYLDLAAGPPVCAHRSPRSKRFGLLDTIELEDKTKLSGRHEKVPKLDFAAGAKATGLMGKEGKKKGKLIAAASSGLQSPVNDGAATGHANAMSASPEPPSATAPASQHPSPANTLGSPSSHAKAQDMRLNLATLASEIMQRIVPPSGGQKSPALTAKRPVEPKVTSDVATAATGDLSKLSVDELLTAIEVHDSKKSSIIHSSLEEEEAFVRRMIALRKELGNVIASGKLVPARTVSVEERKTRAVVVIMTPNGSIRPHVSTRAKRADSRVFIKLVEFDRSLLLESGRGSASISHDPGKAADAIGEGLSGATSLTESPPAALTDGDELPIRDLVIRSSCVRSVLEVQQSSINFGVCDKGEVKEKTIVIHNKSDTLGLFRLRTSGSIASGDLKLGMGRYGVISAFGRKEVENFSFTPSLTGNYQETITVENILDSWNDQAVAVKAMVRKVPTFKVDPASLDFGVVDPASAAAFVSSSASVTKAGKKNGSSVSWPAAQSFVLTNVSKHERTFVITIKVNPAPANATSRPFALLSLTRDEKDAGTALSKNEEEEVEALMQKLKIARRKGKAEKIEKLEARLAELGVTGAPDEEEADAEVGHEGDVEASVQDHKHKEAGDVLVVQPEGGSRPATPGPADPATSSISAKAATSSPVAEEKSKPTTNTLSLTLAPSQKTKILVDLVPATATAANPVGQKSPPPAEPPLDDVRATISVHDKRNTDETVNIAVSATKGDPLESKRQSQERLDKMADRARSTTTDTLHLALMQHCLDLTLNCEVSPTAFCVGSTLFLPSSSAHYARLQRTGKFASFPTTSDPGQASSQHGLILGDGWSRQIPGNTHAEANALTNFRSKYNEVQAVSGGWGGSSAPAVQDEAAGGIAQSTAGGADTGVPPIEQVLRDAECFATMEPCSVRTSGGPSCALELVRAGVKAVYLGVEEPPDFVQCEGVKILEDGGVKVIRTSGLEEACLKAARRGRS
ncbi:hypothetical protein IAU60_004389 [Kwoniella sp. DSM 27419]